MTKKQRNILNFILILISITIIYDYKTKGNTHIGIVENKQIQKDVERTSIRHSNSNSTTRYSYKAILNSASFYCSSDFLFSINDGDEIEYYSSPIFNEVNNYKAVKTQKTEFNSFRHFYGFQFPLIVLCVLLLDFWFNDYMYVFSFIAQVFLAVNFLYVLF